ncbi:hypothetical protein CELL_02678 [Cellulomonas sp. T2.31MG-18]|uniref:AMIN-like domain-containing (lipo)protein n=1 Tax=Cellulomonas sp. T2.31MG-18 TaxID=3157619 RepID=UPI0035EA77C2
MKRFARVLLVILLATTGLALAAPAEATPYCGIAWGSLQKYSAATSIGSITGVRAGRHACYDRLVIDVAGKVDGYEVQYLPKRTTSKAEFAHLQITVDAAMIDPAGNFTFGSDNNFVLTGFSKYRTFRAVRGGGLMKNSGISLDVRARLPFRVFTLDGPGSGSRLVVDVAHRW